MKIFYKNKIIIIIILEESPSQWPSIEIGIYYTSNELCYIDLKQIITPYGLHRCNKNHHSRSFRRAILTLEGFIPAATVWQEGYCPQEACRE